MLPSNKKESFHFTYNIEEKTIDLSEELCAAYGGIPSRFENMPYSFAEQFLHEEDHQIFIDAHHEMVAGAPFATVDFRIKSPASWARVCLFRPDFSSPIITGIVQDVSIRYNYVIAETERKEAEINLRIEKEMEALQLMQAVSESSDMMISVNLTKNTYYIISYDHFLDHKPADHGSYDTFFETGIKGVPADHKDNFINCFQRENLLAAHAKGEKYVYLEHLQHGKDQILHWVSTHAMFTENPYNDDVMIIGVCRDIENRRQKEEEQKRLLTDALLLAEKANTAKSDFLSRMSHDIRTPMNAIIGMTTIAAANLENPEKVSECLNKIGISSRFLLGLINDILDLSKIESGKMSLANEPFSLKTLLNSLENNALVLAENKKQQFHLTVSEPLEDIYYGDKVRIEQIFQNLLSNAHKYTDVGGRFSLNVSCITHSDNRDILQFVVEDTGCGISDAFLAKLFDPFTQEADANNRSGSGLGLAIVQNLTHLMDGTIQIETKPDEGSRFIIELPLHFATNDTEKNSSAAKGHQLFAGDEATIRDRMDTILKNKGTTTQITFHGQRVLLVEDNEINQEVAKTILEMHELIVDVASDGYEAIDAFSTKESGYYLNIFMDIQMPGIDGYETCRRIRQSGHPDAKTIPIYAMTANAFSSDIDKARQCGMDGHIAKPINFDIVAGILAEVIAGKE